MPLGIGIGIGIPFLQKVGTSTPPVLDYIVTELAFAPPDDIIETEGGDPLIVE